VLTRTARVPGRQLGPEVTGPIGRDIRGRGVELPLVDFRLKMRSIELSDGWGKKKGKKLDWHMLQ
jgi:hypothetical protein